MRAIRNDACLWREFQIPDHSGSFLIMESTRNIQLVDSETGICYIINLSTEYHSRAMNDVQYCTQLLGNVKNTELQNVKNTENEEAIECEALDELTSDAHNDGFRWVDSAIKLLVSEFKAQENLLHSGKLSVKKFWEMISLRMKQDGHIITGPQCKSKFNGLKKTYKSVKNHNNKSGNNRRPWLYFEMMDDMFGQRPWVKPILTLDSASLIQPLPSPACSSQSLSPSPSPPPPLLSPTVTSSLQRSCKRQKISHEGAIEKLVKTIHENREDRRRMHEEAMERQDRLLALLEKISEKDSS